MPAYLSDLRQKLRLCQPALHLVACPAAGNAVPHHIALAVVRPVDAGTETLMAFATIMAITRGKHRELLVCQGKI